MKSFSRILFFSFFPALVFSQPYPDPTAVPKDEPYHGHYHQLEKLDAAALKKSGLQTVRVDVSWQSGSETYQVARSVLENSGTEALIQRSKRKNPLGSYQGELRDLKTGRALAFDAVGTGQEMRLLTRGLTFRFPAVDGEAVFVLYAENPSTGAMEKVLTEKISPEKESLSEGALPEVRLVKKASVTPALMLNFYSDGYVPSSGGTAEKFFQDAQRAADSLQKNDFPENERFEIKAVYLASKTALGAPKDLGLPVAERDSFLGLYYPYWDAFGRWYNIVYPTREQKFRDGVGSIPYDYPFVLIDSSAYWGVGNFNELTGIPTKHASSFGYLLLHEFGHYFGLNEEYEEGGKTELAFAPGIAEPWSQNITFHPTTLKWQHLVSPSTPLPTPHSLWTENGPFGAYLGGYAHTEPFGKSHKPGLSCTMKSGGEFCPVCTEAVRRKIRFDVGLF